MATKTENAIEIIGKATDVISKPEENLSRAAKTPEQRRGEIVQRAIEIKRDGQVQAVRCFVKGSGRPHVYAGHTRVASILLINEGFTYETDEEIEVDVLDVEGKPTGEKRKQKVTETIKDENFPLRYVVDDISEEEAEVRGLIDNFQTNKPNDLDLAHAAKNLQDRFGYTDKRVTEILAISDPYKVGRIKKLLGAPQVVRDAVASGDLATAAALEIVGAKGNARTAAVNAVKEGLEKGKVPTQASIQKVIRDTPAEAPKEGEAAAPTREKLPAPTGTAIRKAIQELYEAVKNDGDNLPPEYLKVVEPLNKFVNGRMSAETFSKRLDEAFGLTPKKSGGKKAGKGKGPDAEVAQEEAAGATV
jgi:ParB-like chromosome segregation protein Spo0J